MPGRRTLGLVLVAVSVFAAVSGSTAGAASESESPTLRVVFPEGFSVRQMVDRVAAVRRIAIREPQVMPVLTGAAYAKATSQARPPKGFAARAGHRRIEGFLFPSLYQFGAATTAAELVAAQIRAFEREWRRVDLRAARTRGRTPYDVLVIASMIERETIAPEERPLVSAVIYNRLARNMPLAIDATLRYGLGIPGTRPLKASHLRSSSPYNTRRVKGLPPTPIGNPGLASMRAAARPAKVDYLYYVRKPDGIHHFFTADEQEFCEKAREYGYRC